MVAFMMPPVLSGLAADIQRQKEGLEEEP